MTDDDIPLPGETPSSAEKAEAAKEAVSWIDSLYSSIIGKQRDSTKEEKAFLNLLSKRQEMLDNIARKMVGLTGEKKAYARAEYEAIEEETKRIASVEKYFGLTKGITKELQEQERIRKAIEKTGAALGMQAVDIARLQALAAADLMLEHRQGRAAAFGEKVGGVAADFSRVAGVADILFNSQFQNAMVGAIGKATTLMQGGHYGGGLGAQSLSNQLFGGTGTAQSPIERLQDLNKVLANSPRVANESTVSMNKMIGTMAFFGADMTKITETLIKGSRESGLSAEYVARIYNFSDGAAKDLGLSTLETADNLMDMTKIFRQVGGGVFQASGVLSAFSKDIKALGVNLTGIERVDLMTKFVQGVSSLPFDKLAGLTTYATGKPIQSLTEADMGGGNALGIATRVFQKISSQMAPGFVNQGAATEKTAELFGMHLNALQTISLQKILKEGITPANQAEFERMTDPMKHMAMGIDQLQNTIEPLTRIANYTENIQSMMSTWSATITGLSGVIPLLAALKIGGSVVSALGGAAKVTAAALGPEAAAIAGGGALTAEALGVGGVALVAGSVAATAAVGYGIGTAANKYVVNPALNYLTPKHGLSKLR